MCPAAGGSGEMIEVWLLEGKQAGAWWTARRFPVRIGRHPDSDIALEEPGVWDDHLELDYEREAGFVARPLSEGTVLVDGHPAGTVAVRNGSTLRVGGALLQFWMAPAAQRRFRLLEACLWLGLLLLCAAEVILMLWLTR